MKLEYQDNISPEDFLKPLLSDLVEKFPEIQVSLNYCNNEDEYTIFIRPVCIYNDIESRRIPENIFYKFIEKYEEDIYFHANDDDYYFDGIVLTGKEYKN